MLRLPGEKKTNDPYAPRPLTMNFGEACCPSTIVQSARHLAGQFGRGQTVDVNVGGRVVANLDTNGCPIEDARRLEQIIKPTIVAFNI